MPNKLPNKKNAKTRRRTKAKDGKRNIVGPRLRELRRRFRPKVTQDDLAGRVATVGVTLDRTAIYRIENGTRSVSDVELEALAKALQAPIGSLFSKRRGHPNP